MKKFFNNKGSTLVLLIMAIAVISLLGTSILGVTMMNLKIKKTNTALKQTFYLSESGLDRTYSNAYSFVLDAVNESNILVKTFIESFTPEKMADLIEDEPSSSYLKKTSIDGVDVYSYNDSVIVEEAKSIFNDNYKSYIDSKIATLDIDEDKLKVEVTNGGWVSLNGNEQLLLSINSQYINDNNIKKSTAVNLYIGIPEYNEPYTVSTELVPVNPFWTKVITAENLNIEDDNSVKFNGDVFVNKNLNLKGTGNVDFLKNLAVKKDISIINSKLLNTQNVFTENILLDGTGANFNSSGSAVYVKDDLEMNAAKQKVDIKGSYYGFQYGGEEIADNTLNSSIIINTSDISSTNGSKLNIDGDLYLLGTSYIKGFPYPTGESVSVIGNYFVYSMPLEGGFSDGKSLKWDNVIHEEFEPLPPLVTRFVDGMELQPWHKSAYFEYYKQYSDAHEDSPKLNLGNNNITIDGQKISMGASINEENVIASKYEISDWEKYSKDGGTAYNLQIGKLGDSTVLKENLKFSEEVKLGELTGDIIDTDKNNYIYISKNYLDFELTEGTYKGLIITNGDINIYGNVDFTGTILCGGNINIKDNNPKKFTYDKNVVSKFIVDNNLHNKIFESNTSKNKISITTYKSIEDGTPVNVDFSNLLKFNNWEIK